MMSREHFLAEVPLLINYIQGKIIPDNLPTYKDFVKKSYNSYKSETINTVSWWYDDPDTQENSVAIHHIIGTVVFDSWWRFSTKRFMNDLLRAENNPNIIAHLIVVRTGGGESTQLDVAAETVKNCSKPVIVYIEGVCGSAGVFIVCNADKIYCGSPMDVVGSIGTMFYCLNFDGYYEALKIKIEEHYAEQSTLKNDKVNKLFAGDPSRIIKEELNPLAQQFIDTVAAALPETKKHEDKGVFKGETYFAHVAQEYGLIHGINSFQNSLQEAYDLGLKWAAKNKAHNKALSLI